MTEPKENESYRFSGKAAQYAAGRPGYSEASLDFICEKLKLAREATVADIGAGTGILTQSLRRRFARVIAVEPNADMRAALAEEKLAGTAENTGIPHGSIDVIFAAQAFHWFDVEKSRAEFKRILKEPGHVILFWNERNHTPGTGSESLKGSIFFFCDPAGRKKRRWNLLEPFIQCVCCV
jgi:SAM-dependent methyltransferase